MKVKNRQGQLIAVSYDAIKLRITRLCTEEELEQVDIDSVIIQTINGIYDGISTSELDNQSARVCASLQSGHYMYDVIAARIVASNMSKSVRSRLMLPGPDADGGGGGEFGALQHDMKRLRVSDHDCTCTGGDVRFSAKMAYVAGKCSTLSPAFVAYVAKHADALDGMIQYERNSTNHTYFSLRTLERSYLISVDGLCVESPQDMWMRVAAAIHGVPFDGEADPAPRLRNVRACYEAMSTGLYTHATPTLFNAGMRVQQCSSCFVADTEVATVNAGVKKIQDVAIGDLVVTHKGNVRPVTQLHRNPLGDRAVHCLKVASSKEVFVTGNHRFWAVRNGDAEPSWVPVEDLQVGDYVGVPTVMKPEVVKPPTVIDIMDWLPHDDPMLVYEIVGDNGDMVRRATSFSHSNLDYVDNDVTVCRRSKAVARMWTLDQDFANLIGMYLGDGNLLTAKGKPHGISFTVFVDNKPEIDYIIDVGERILGIEHSIHKVKGQNVIQVQFHSCVIGTAFFHLFGKGFAGKILPALMFSQPYSIVIGLMAGLLTTDGCIATSGVTSLQLSNQPLMNQLYHLFRQHGIEVSFRKCPPPRQASHSQAWVMSVPFINEVVALTLKYYPDGRIERLMGRAPTHIRNQHTPVIVGDQTFMRVHANDPMPEMRPEFVYTLGVEDDHSYAVEGLLAENCYLLGTADDLGCIYKTLSDCAQISKWAGGIGLHVSNVRAKGTTICSTNGTSDGIIPMLQVYNATARYCNQSGRRKGSIAVYLEPWHADVWEFVELRRNVGAETERARDLFLALWVPDEFMERLERDDDWYLMSHDACPGLIDAFGEDFSRLYNRYIAEGRAVRSVKARALWQHIISCQLETGTPYILYKDHVNRKCNQSNVGTIRSSNLCAEITQYSDDKEYAVCNLASISIPKHVDAKGGCIDHAALHETARQVAFNLNNLIDINAYPTREADVSNTSLRPIGIGIQGLGDVYCMLKVPYDDPRAMQIDADVMETIYHGAMSASVELAIAHGPYARFQGSPASRGLLQMDLWRQHQQPQQQPSGRYDWDAMRAKVVAHGLRNSMLTALMPTASTSQVLGNCESFEPFQSNVFKRSTLAGEFLVINRHLMRDLMAAGLWSEEMRKELIQQDGSLQNIAGIPEPMKRVYATVWEVPQRAVIDHAVARGPFVDQSQSMNLYMLSPSFQKLSRALIYAWQQGLKTGLYYLRSAPAKEAVKHTGGGGGVKRGSAETLAPAEPGGGAAAAAAAAEGEPRVPGGVCKLRRAGDEVCEMCSA